MKIIWGCLQSNIIKCSIFRWVKAMYNKMHIKLYIKMSHLVIKCFIIYLLIRQTAVYVCKLFTHIDDFCMNELSFNYAILVTSQEQDFQWM